MSRYRYLLNNLWQTNHDIEHVLIEKYIDRMSGEDFLKSVNTRGCCYQKAGNYQRSRENLPPKFREKHPDIPWCQIAGIEGMLKRSRIPPHNPRD